MMRRSCRTLLALVVSGAYIQTCFAHSPFTSQGEDAYAALLSALLLVSIHVLYTFGSWHTRPRAWQQISFHTGMVICYLAALGPLDDWAKTSTTAHMVQHMTFMMIVTPLWVIASPLPAFYRCGKIWLRLWQPFLKLVRYPMLMAYIHGATIWLWHLPYFYTLALDNVWWHIIEHACFIITAGLFWWSVLKSNHLQAHWALLASLLTLMHTGFLGALLTFAGQPLYGDSRSLADQQLAGLIMWVPGAAPYLCAACWAAARWYRQRMHRAPVFRDQSHAPAESHRTAD